MSQDDRVFNETKVVGNRSAQFRVTIVAQQLFHVTLCVASSIREWHFQLILSLQFYRTDFMLLVSSLYDAP
jgi:hypothetical protein